MLSLRNRGLLDQPDYSPLGDLEGLNARLLDAGCQRG
jgi:hypothetical protein